ncbi:hypothetical protein M3Y98_01042300 [Aphelenchoides besseyi]|nr:hypothetical protein M3Y98_01042300 [Aphelenchoides besseyi]KAI6209864.1 hypothetical protein M3Y96_00266300 [Aphelenchoides besseyi]
MMSGKQNASTSFAPLKTESIYCRSGKRFRRRELSSLDTNKLHDLLEELMARVDVASNDLVGLLIKRDEKLMENDALRMEVDDLLTFTPTAKLDIPPPALQIAPKSKQRCK